VVTKLSATTGTVRVRLLALLAVATVGLALLPAVAGAAPTCAKADHPGGDWPVSGHDLENTRNQPKERRIGPAEARTLAPVWEVNSTAVEADGDFTSTPVIADGCVFVGSVSGWVLALNADTGELVWKTKLAQGINNSVTVDGDEIFAISGLRLASLDRATGKILWQSKFVDEQDGNDTYGAPVAFTYRGSKSVPARRVVFVGISGGGAELGDAEERAKFQGTFTLLDGDSGDILRKTYVIPEKLWKDGYAGGGIWATPALDPATGYAYVGSGNPFQPQVQHERTDAILKIDMNPSRKTFGEIVDHYQGTLEEYVEGFRDMPCVDVPGNPPPWYPQGAGACMDQDLDFGASPNLFKSEDGRLLVGEGQKSGEYHVLDAKTMKADYVSLVGPPTALGGIVGSTAVDDNSVFGPITTGGYLWGVDRADGAVQWASPVGDGAHWGHAVSSANGVVYTIDLGGLLRAYDGSNGLPLLGRPQSEASPVAANLGGGVSIARNTVYAVTGSRVIAHQPSGGGGGGGGPELPEPPGGGGEGAPAGSVVLAQPGSFVAGYTTAVAPYVTGGEMTFVNGDSVMHDVVASVYGDGKQPWCKNFPKGKCPLFWTPLIGLGGTTPILGLEDLESGGMYPFYCSIHPGMKANIVAL
jgi:polyvinyl alcohol dehydrogenase (cytochrome)